MKKKGFTLVELLAVIVILAIMMVLAIPKMLDVIEKAELEAYKDSVNLMVKAAKLQRQSSEVTGKDKISLPATFEYQMIDGKTGQTQDSINKYAELKFKGDKPQSGTITITKEGKVTVEKLVSKNGKYCAVKIINGQVEVGKSKQMGCIIGEEEVIKDKKACELEIDKDNSDILYIDSVSDLYAFSQSVNNGNTYSGKTIKLRNNLDMSEVNTTKNTCEEGGFNPIGNSKNPFSGTFDGEAKKISNLTINKADDNEVGIFGYLFYGTVKELQLDNITIKGNNQVGIVGSSSSSSILSVSANNINIQGNTNVGGIAGYVYNGTTKEICLDNITIIGGTNVGGAVGNSTVSINNILIKKGTVQANAGNAGYIVCAGTYATNSIAENLTVTATGAIYTANETDSYVGKEKDINFYEAVGLDTWIGGDNDSSGYYFDYDSDGEIRLINSDEKPITFTLEGEGTKDNPYVIKNEKQWKEATTRLNSYYKVTGNLNFDNNNTISKRYYMMGSYYNPFRGLLNGNFNTISNVIINASKETEIGVFGYLLSGIVKELQLDNITIKGNNQVGIVGSSSSSNILSVSANNINIQGNINVGGIAGYIYNGTTKEICLDNITIIGGANVGGAVGNSTLSINDILVKKGTVQANAGDAGYIVCRGAWATNSIVENLTVKATGSIYDAPISYNTYSSVLTTSNGLAPSDAFSKYYIGDLNYYTDKIETLYNGDKNNTGYFFDYVESKGGIYLVKAYIPESSSTGSSSTTVKPNCTCSGGCVNCANSSSAISCQTECHLNN